MATTNIVYNDYNACVQWSKHSTTQRTSAYSDARKSNLGEYCLQLCYYFSHVPRNQHARPSSLASALYYREKREDPILSTLLSPLSRVEREREREREIRGKSLYNITVHLTLILSQ
jgi:hypothetical protein